MDDEVVEDGIGDVDAEKKMEGWVETDGMMVGSGV